MSMPEFAAANVNSSTMIRARATPALMYMSSSVLLNVLVPEIEAVPVNAPLEGVHGGGVYFDRSESEKVLWYVPAYSLAADPDPAFAFKAIQRGHDEHGNPFFSGQLTFSLTSSIPASARDAIAQFPGASLREIPIDGLTASLNTTFKDDKGNDQITSFPGKVVRGADGNLTLTFDTLLGETVVTLYEDLVMVGGASVVLSGNYILWRQAVPSPPPPPPRTTWHHIPVDDPVVRDLRLPGPVRQVAAHPVFLSAPARMSAVASISPSVALPAAAGTAAVKQMQFAPATVARVAIDPSLRVVIDPSLTDHSAPPKPVYQRVITPMVLKFDFEKKFAASPYSLQFEVNDGASSHPIINVNDLREFNVRQSEFKQLTALGDLTQRYSSLSRAYIGVLSKTIVVIPSRYVISRNMASVDTATVDTAALACECLAVLDSASSGVSKCKFQFSFVIAPDISPIDLLRFAEEVASNSNLGKDYKVRLPSFLKEGGGPKLQTAFQSSTTCLPTSFPCAFSLAVVIRDDESGSPAVADANILIKQLCSVQEPFLTGSIALKLDDFYPDPVEAGIILNFHKTAGETSELNFMLNEEGHVVDIVNHSSFDLRFTRYALSNASGINVADVDQLVKKGEKFQAPLPADHNALSVSVDRQMALTGAISKSDVQGLMRFLTKDVQNTQYMIGISAISVNFIDRAISQIDVSVILTDLREVAVPGFSLVNLRKLNQTNVVIPIQFAISTLTATLEFRIRHTGSQQPDSVLTLQHEFIEEPIMVLNDSDLNAAQAH
jgi:hypothetical protein